MLERTLMEKSIVKSDNLVLMGGCVELFCESYWIQVLQRRLDYANPWG